MELEKYGESGLFTGREKMALEDTDLMTRTPVEVSDALFARLRQEFNEPELLELTVAIGWDNFKARFHHALDIGSDNFGEGAYCPRAIPAGEQRETISSV